MHRDYITITDNNHNVLLNAVGNFNFDENEKVILNKDITVFVSKKSPLFDTQQIDEKTGRKFIKYYPEEQDDNEQNT